MRKLFAAIWGTQKSSAFLWLQPWRSHKIILGRILVMFSIIENVDIWQTPQIKLIVRKVQIKAIQKYLFFWNFAPCNFHEYNYFRQTSTTQSWNKFVLWVIYYKWQISKNNSLIEWVQQNKVSMEPCNLIFLQEESRLTPCYGLFLAFVLQM